MKSKAAFVLGAGLGYVLGTRAGRQQFEKIKGWAGGVWTDSRVQSQVNDLEAHASEFARTQGTALKDKVTETVKGAVHSASGSSTETPTAEDLPSAAPPGLHTAAGGPV